MEIVSVAAFQRRYQQRHHDKLAAVALLAAAAVARHTPARKAVALHNRLGHGAVVRIVDAIEAGIPHQRDAAAPGAVAEVKQARGQHCSHWEAVAAAAVFSFSFPEGRVRG